MLYSVEVRHVAPTVIQVWAYDIEANSETEAEATALQRHESNLEWGAAMSGRMVAQTPRVPGSVEHKSPRLPLGYSVQNVSQTQD